MSIAVLLIVIGIAVAVAVMPLLGLILVAAGLLLIFLPYLRGP